ncbi:hypothetical protein BAC3_01804 [uncultured bacterium]|nr:hypothetical protein BAC3_01804 [uncultured bacterium]
MLHTIISEDTRWVMNLEKKARQLLVSVRNFKETHRSLFMKCAVIFMSVKIGLILLATFATMVFLLTSVTPYLAAEMSKTKAMFFTIPLTVVITLKLYFIGKILMTYDRSKSTMKAVVDVILLKGRHGMRRVEETFSMDLPPLSLGKIKNR